MDCNEARPLLDANADHELPAPDAQRKVEVGESEITVWWQLSGDGTVVIALRPFARADLGV